MVSKDQAIGWVICIACVAVALLYTVGLFNPVWESIRLWLVIIPVFIAFIAIMAIGAWIGWTMATTPPPKPLDEIEVEEPPAEEVRAEEVSSEKEEEGKKKK